MILKPIDWETPANILEKIIEYEAVHQIKSWDELRSRLEPQDRKCFAYFHPAMEDEPLIFIEVALTEDITEKINQILNPDRTMINSEEATTAVFYSISNCQKGLQGISFGNFLIKQVAKDLQNNFEKVFCIENFEDSWNHVADMLKIDRQPRYSTNRSNEDYKKYVDKKDLSTEFISWHKKYNSYDYALYKEFCA